MKTEIVPIGTVKVNPNNPRIIQDGKFDKLVESIREFPEMLKLRPIVVNADGVVLGGNMRLKACKKAGLKEIPVLHADSLTEAQQREFIIKDNVGFGEWDWELISQDWDAEQLEGWGLDLPGFDNVEDLGEEFSLPDGDKEPFQRMAFTLADEQAEVIKNALAQIKATDEYKYAETMGNGNSNGNALYLIVMQWAGQRK